MGPGDPAALQPGKKRIRIGAAQGPGPNPDGDAGFPNCNGNVKADTMKQLPMHKSIAPFGKDIFVLEMDEIHTEKRIPFMRANH